MATRIGSVASWKGVAATRKRNSSPQLCPSVLATESSAARMGHCPLSIRSLQHGNLEGNRSLEGTLLP